MILKRRSRNVLCALTCGSVVLVGAHRATAQESDSASRPVRPVTILELQERDFAREVRLTGSVAPYRQENVGFEVNGRLLWVLDLGQEVQGPAFDDDGQLVRKGDVVAKLDDTRYRLKVSAIEARLAALEKTLQAQRIDVERVAEANLNVARAQLRVAQREAEVAEQRIEEAIVDVDRARKNLARQHSLRESESPAFRQKNLDEVTATYDGARARQQQREALLLAKLQASDAQISMVRAQEAKITFKEAEIGSTEAKIAELTEELGRAREDLADTTLFAPFSGRLTGIHVSQGAVVSSLQPVVSLTLMDPMQVRVEVSADAERLIRTGDRAWVYPKDPSDPDRADVEVNALVFETSAAADLNTRTFRIDLMVRNRRRLIHDVAPSTKDLPLVTKFLPTVRRYEGEPGPLFVPSDSIYLENGSAYVFRLPGIGFHDGANKNAIGRHLPEMVEVALGDEYFTVIKWNFRSLTESTNLREGDFLVVEPKAEHLNGLVIDRPQWLLRPGDLVPVHFSLDTTPLGYYVPIDAITMTNDRHVIHAVVDGRVSVIPVDVHETYQESRRIEAAALKSGLAVVVGGVHYVTDGERVTVTGKVDAEP